MRAYEKANPNDAYATWREKVRGHEVEAQLRCIENCVEPESLWRKCSSYARKRVKRKAAGIVGRRGNVRDFKKWLGVYNDARASVDAALQDEADKMLADPALLRTALSQHWEIQPGMVVEDDGRVVMDASANPLGGAKLLYGHRITDGRFNNGLGGIIRKKADSAWQNRLGNGSYIVGDIRLAADIELLEDAAEVILEIREDEKHCRCRVKRSATDVAFQLEAFGKPVGDRVSVPYEGKPVRIDFASVDDTLLLSIDGKPRERFEFEVNANVATRMAEAAFVCTAGKAAVDNIELYRDIYYIASPRMGTDGVATLGGRQYYAFGDNCPSSNDSRMWGVVPEDNLVGEAFMVIWPLWRIRMIR